MFLDEGNPTFLSEAENTRRTCVKTGLFLTSFHTLSLYHKKVKLIFNVLLKLWNELMQAVSNSCNDFGICSNS